MVAVCLQIIFFYLTWRCVNGWEKKKINQWKFGCAYSDTRVWACPTCPIYCTALSFGPSRWSRGDNYSAVRFPPAAAPAAKTTRDRFPKTSKPEDITTLEEKKESQSENEPYDMWTKYIWETLVILFPFSDWFVFFPPCVCERTGRFKVPRVK